MTEQLCLSTPRRLAMIAHDGKKDEMVAFAQSFRKELAAYDIVATGTTGGRLLEAVPGLRIQRVASGPLGGDAQISAMLVERKIDGVLFFIDPLTSHPHDPDIHSLIRLSVVYNVPLALNPRAAACVLNALPSLPNEPIEPTVPPALQLTLGLPDSEVAHPATPT